MIAYSFGSDAYTESTIVVDFNGDRRQDIAVVNVGTASIEVLLGNGDGTFEAPIIYSTGNNSEPLSVIAGDFNNDGYQDLAFSYHGEFEVGVVFGYGDGTFGSLMTYSNQTYTYIFFLVAGDFNNDDHLDLTAQDYWGYDKIGVLLGSVDGTFTAQTGSNSTSCYRPSSFAVGDFDSDGHLDLAVTNSYDN
jgi:hypothetical protein